MTFSLVTDDLSFRRPNLSEIWFLSTNTLLNIFFRPVTIFFRPEQMSTFCRRHFNMYFHEKLFLIRNLNVVFLVGSSRTYWFIYMNGLAPKRYIMKHWWHSSVTHVICVTDPRIWLTHASRCKIVYRWITMNSTEWFPVSPFLSYFFAIVPSLPRWTDRLNHNVWHSWYPQNVLRHHEGCRCTNRRQAISNHMVNWHWKYSQTNHNVCHSYTLTGNNQTLQEKVQVVGNPLVSLLFAGLSCQCENPLWHWAAWRVYASVNQAIIASYRRQAIFWTNFAYC